MGWKENHRAIREYRQEHLFEDETIVRCRDCDVILSEINWHPSMYAARNNQCTFCKNPEGTRKHAEKRELRNRQQRVRKYGISSAQINGMMLQQKNCCLICGTQAGKRALSIDHDHQTGKVRGLLCQPCNGGIGLLQDNPALLESAAQYLRRAKLSLSLEK